jgi:hypothetical protein
MKRDDDPKLWDLLGHAEEPKVSPFFSRNVLRDIRQRGTSSALREWFGLRRLIPVTGVAMALLAVALLRTQTSVPSSSKSQSDKMEIVSAQDYEVISDLDDLLASDDNNSWEDSVLL